MRKTALLSAVFTAASVFGGGPEMRVACKTPARALEGVAKSQAWEPSLLTGNGSMGEGALPQHLPLTLEFADIAIVRRNGVC